MGDGRWTVPVPVPVPASGRSGWGQACVGGSDGKPMAKDDGREELEAGVGVRIAGLPSVTAILRECDASG